MSKRYSQALEEMITSYQLEIAKLKRAIDRYELNRIHSKDQIRRRNKMIKVKNTEIEGLKSQLKEMQAWTCPECQALLLWTRKDLNNGTPICNKCDVDMI